MKKITIFTKSIFILLAVLISLQISFISNSFAAPGDADLSIAGEIAFINEGLSSTVCSSGPGTVTEFTLDFNLTNWEIQEFAILPYATSATDPGSVNSSTGVWTGILDAGDCIQVGAFGQATVAVGGTVTISANISSSILEDTSLNADPDNLNNTYTLAPFSVLPAPDIAIETRLLTSGPIVNNSPVSYEINMLNIGAGDMPDDPGFHPVLVFVMPNDATFVGVEDLNVSDGIDVVSCDNVGSVSVFLGPSFAAYDGDTVVCDITMESGVIPVGGPYPVQFNMTAGSEFATGDTEVIAIIQGGERDSLMVQLAIAQGEDPFALDINNIVRLSYDANAIVTTINRCPGQAEIITDGTACFRVSFNKLIYAPLFTKDVLVLDGGGSVADSDFRQLDDYTWEVIVRGIPQGNTLTLSLVPGAVKDFSAVLNGAQVLGENRVRFEVTGAVQALPETGIDSTEILGSMLFILFGALLFVKARRKEDFYTYL